MEVIADHEDTRNAIQVEIFQVEIFGHKEKVWVSTPGSGLEKRQCSLQVCFSAEDNQMKIEIIFRGTSGGKRISTVEKQSYHQGVDVYWQKCAWADLEVSLEWIKKTLKEVCKK